MKANNFWLLTLSLIFINCSGNAQDSKITHKSKHNMKYKELTPEEKHVIINKGTEQPFSGKYDLFDKEGTYHCKQCDAALYTSSSKFDGHCGWPAFDDEIKGAVTHIADRDGRRTEIVCTNCDGHLGHVFIGEKFTAKNTRHCVNSISIAFKPTVKASQNLQKAIFAAGCFWGVEYYFQKAEGVINTEVGYTAGHKDNPTYQEVCSKKTGHVEAIEVSYDANVTNFETLARLFFETHDPTQTDGQGPDLGSQYLSVAFFNTPEEKATLERLIGLLTKKGLTIATTLKPVSTFWPAEEIHQRYYDKTKKAPYCHSYKKLF